jgi:hypothetical protein
LGPIGPSLDKLQHGLEEFWGLQEPLARYGARLTVTSWLALWRVAEDFVAKGKALPPNPADAAGRVLEVGPMRLLRHSPEPSTAAPPARGLRSVHELAG